MSKFHFGRSGKPAQCNAKKGNCPFGSDAEHYSSRQEAQKALEDKNTKEYATMESASKSSNKTHDKDLYTSSKEDRGVKNEYGITVSQKDINNPSYQQPTPTEDLYFADGGRLAGTRKAYYKNSLMVRENGFVDRKEGSNIVMSHDYYGLKGRIDIVGKPGLRYVEIEDEKGKTLVKGLFPTSDVENTIKNYVEGQEKSVQLLENQTRREFENFYESIPYSPNESIEKQIEKEHDKIDKKYGNVDKEDTDTLEKIRNEKIMAKSEIMIMSKGLREREAEIEKRLELGKNNLTSKERDALKEELREVKMEKWSYEDDKDLAESEILKKKQLQYHGNKTVDSLENDRLMKVIQKKRARVSEIDISEKNTVDGVLHDKEIDASNEMKLLSSKIQNKYHSMSRSDVEKYIYNKTSPGEKITSLFKKDPKTGKLI